MTDRSILRILWLLAAIAALLTVLVLATGSGSDQRTLASALASGLVIAVVVAAWELARRREEQQRMERQSLEEAETSRNRLRAIQRTLTRFIGAELARIAAQVQLVGVDDDGNPVELFDDIDQAMHAFENHQGAERVHNRVAHASTEKAPPQQLVLSSWEAIDRFFFWFSFQFQPMLTFFIESGDDRTVDALLELRRTEYPHQIVGHLLWKHDARSGWLQNMTDNKAQWAAYLSQVASPVLLRYAELLRAVEGVPSGIADGGAETG